MKSTEDDSRDEFEYLEVKEWQNSNSRDDYNTWKLKKYVDERIMQVVIGVIVFVIVFSIVGRNF